jgi:glycosyltransferase involved in cell wall biosynthesis
MTPRRILVVLYHFPPASSVGATRWQAHAKYLRRLGHEVTILTTNALGSEPDDEENGVVRAPDVVANPAVRRLLGRSPTPRAGTAPGDEKAAPSPVVRLAVPDPTAPSWAVSAAAVARRLVRERRIDCVVTSSPPESAHLVGLALRGRVPWIADFRDGWTFESIRPRFYTGLQHRLDAWLEARVVSRADRVLAVSEPIAADFRERLGVDAVHLPNAWDPELAGESAGPVPEVDPNRVTLVHTGALTGAWGRDPGPLLDALRELGDARLDVVLAGPESEAALVPRHGLEGIARHVGRLPRPAALALQRQADALLLVTSPHSGEATGKLAEYIGAGRPIVALAKDNEAARIVEETGTGLTVDPADPEAIRAALRRAAEGTLPYEPRGLERYLFPAPAEAVAAEVERVIRARESAVR